MLLFSCAPCYKLFLIHIYMILLGEDLTTTLENTIVFNWRQLLDSGLHQLVRLRCDIKLSNKTLASLKPEISQALSSLMEDHEDS